MYDKRTTKKKTAELLREMTCAPRAHYAEQSHSQFTSREESNRIANCLQIVVSYYNLVSQENFNPRSPWGERRRPRIRRRSYRRISIHAPRGGSDPARPSCPACTHRISIHAPRGGSDHIQNANTDRKTISIHAPRGGSDVNFFFLKSKRSNFNPRSPWGERPRLPLRPVPGRWISIHAPRGGSDRWAANPPCANSISIHAPRGGSDYAYVGAWGVGIYFNPRSPWGERRRLFGVAKSGSRISIHAPRGGSDLLSLLPHPAPGAISIHAPRGGSD